jgi:NitT/TauT family transport system substrate-binding protein
VKNIVRRALLGLALAALIPTGAPPAGAQSSPLIRVGTGPNDQSLPLVYGDKGGVFKRHGLNVEVSRQTTTSVMAAAVVGGSLEIAQGSTLGAVQAIAKGLPLTLIGNLGLYNADRPDIGLLVLNSSPIRTPKDLEGKAIAVVALQDMNAISTLMWLEQRGVDIASLKYVEVPASASLAALEQNRIVATTVYEPFYSAFMGSGKVRVIGYPYDAIAKRYSNSVIYAETKWAAEHRDLIDRFLRALQEAGTYVSTHEAETAPMLAQFAGLDPAAMGQVKHAERMTAILPADIQPIIDAAFKFKVIPKSFPAQDILCSCALRR